MTRMIALLRGINVGAGNRIRMDALRLLFEQAGFSGVATYIQSGNVLFSTDAPERSVPDTIQRILLEGAEIKTTVVLRSAEELAAIVSNCPFSSAEIEVAQRDNTEGESFYVYLLPQAPDPETLQVLDALPQESDRFVIVGRDVYLLLRQRIRNSKLAIKLQKLFPEATARNWNTINQLHQLSQS